MKQKSENSNQKTKTTNSNISALNIDYVITSHSKEFIAIDYQGERTKISLTLNKELESSIFLDAPELRP